MFKAKGKICEIFNEVQLTENFKKRELVLEYSENFNYPQFITFTSFNQFTQILDNLYIGDEVEIEFYIKGKPYHKNGVTYYFNTFQINRIIRDGEIVRFKQDVFENRETKSPKEKYNIQNNYNSEIYRPSYKNNNHDDFDDDLPF